MTVIFDPQKVKDELAWLKQNPAFEQRPATIREFLDREYLDIKKNIRKAVAEVLEEIFGDTVDGHRIAKYSEAMITGGIGIGKTTIASIVLTYLAHWVLCLKDPQDFFGLLPGTRIAFMQMSTSGKQAEEVVFGDIKARVDHSPWFQNNYQYNPVYKKELRFEAKDIWILPGDSAETTFEGYNILGGILDEADSHKITLTKDYADQGFTTIHSRITSRFEDRGFLMVIGQMKKANGFAARKFKEYQKKPNAYAVRMAIWESVGWDRYLRPDGSRDSFWYDIKRHEIVPDGAAVMVASDNLIEIPKLFLPDFQNNPEKALRDLAGIPPATGSPFISLVYKIEACRERYVLRNNGLKSPVRPDGAFESWFHALDSRPRVAHLDMAYSPDGDALGFAMGHVDRVEEIDGERKPYIVFDLVMRVHAAAGREIFIGDIRRMIYTLRDDKKFRIKKVTMDGFQSTDTRQQLQRRRIDSEIVSVDKQTLPYEDLREAIYEDRVEFPEYLIRLRPDDTSMTEILVKELSELVDAGGKVEHPEGGSKDVADACAGVVYTLMGERQYHRRKVHMDLHQKGVSSGGADASAYPLTHPGLHREMGLQAPMPPAGVDVWQPPMRGR